MTDRQKHDKWDYVRVRLKKRKLRWASYARITRMNKKPTESNKIKTMKRKEKFESSVIKWRDN